ncbi:hypothetical protein [Leclercia sp. UBA5958]|uniref:hypothetical protein n=1 Tax=Leclercia sp. UBA5958 TaxID=1946742 RepID=UPI002580459E|nr:hypothetical protein [Leclercia sp. UBA5958]
MTNKQALRQTAEKAQEHGVFNMDIHSETVLALLDELEAAEKRVAELEAVKFKLSDSKLLLLAKDIVESLVDTGSSDPEYTQQYLDWTCKRIRAAGRINGEG